MICTGSGWRRKGVRRRCPKRFLYRRGTTKGRCVSPELIRQIESDSGRNRNWLVEQMRDESPGVTPFVGAGMSRRFGFPGWSEFLVSVAIKAGMEEQVK